MEVETREESCARVKISNWEVYGRAESIRAAKFPMSVAPEGETAALTEGVKRLAQTPMGEGHDNWLLGVVVQYDVAASIKWWTEMERYHFADIVSSQSTMHRIARFDLEAAYDSHTDQRMVAVMKELAAEYNENPTPDAYLRLLYSNPCGMILTARMTTNYRQLKTIYRQRKNHRLPEWREFCRWIEEELPMSELITGSENGEG